jgi:arginyl-tRNA synthetase
MNLRDQLNAAVERAMRAVDIPADCQALLTRSTRAEFGDYQANGAMGAAKRMGSNPRELAARIVAAFDGAGMVERLEIAGPGFINIHLATSFLEQRLTLAANDARLGIAASEQPQTVVVDYSSPNLAKEMHVGHLRSSIIGDAVVRALEFRGDRVIRQNHVGDWGTQFGMLIAHLEDVVRGGTSIEDAELGDLEVFYRNAKQRFDGEADFAERARDYVVRLQSGDQHCRGLWQRFIDISVTHSEEIYHQLNVSLTRADIKAESAYNDDLPRVIEDLRERGLLAESDGARVVFLEELRDREGNPQAVIVQNVRSPSRCARVRSAAQSRHGAARRPTEPALAGQPVAGVGEFGRSPLASRWPWGSLPPGRSGGWSCDRRQCVAQSRAGSRRVRAAWQS